MSSEAARILSATVLLVALLAGLLLLSEGGQQRLATINVSVTEIQERQTFLAQLERRLNEAESAQRGFLITNHESYLAPYIANKDLIGKMLGELRNQYHGEPSPPTAALAQLDALVTRRFAQLEEGLRLNRMGDAAGASDFVRAGSGVRTMQAIHDVIGLLERDQALALEQTLATGLADLKLMRVAMASATALNAILVIVLAILVLRDTRRSAVRTAELELRVRERTAELGALSSHLQEVTERDKKVLAQELHDALGGMLVATKMDVAWLRARLASTDPDIQLRWQRILRSLDQGVDFKRRVVEQLRPTLLDNMGLFAALRWQFLETCGRAGLRCIEEFPDQEPRLTSAAAIALYRIAQESFTNILKHANASEIRFSLSTDDTQLRMSITDNGRGIAETAVAALQRHGLAGMRHRVEGLRGNWRASRVETGGTEILVEIPLAGILASATEQGAA